MIHGKGNFTRLQHLAYDLSKSYLCLTSGSTEISWTAHRAECTACWMHCQWSLRLQTLWGRTFLLAVISSRMISQTVCFPFPQGALERKPAPDAFCSRNSRGAGRVCGTEESSHVCHLNPVSAKCLEIWRYKVLWKAVLLVYVTDMLQQNMIFQDMKWCFIPWMTQGKAGQCSGMLGIQFCQYCTSCHCKMASLAAKAWECLW